MIESMKSNCCNAIMITVSGDEGTGYWKCKACNKPCGPASENKPCQIIPCSGCNGSWCRAHDQHEISCQSPELSSLGKHSENCLGCLYDNKDDVPHVKECTCEKSYFDTICPVHGIGALPVSSGDTKELCDCGFPQSSPIPHKHSIPESSSGEYIKRMGKAAEEVRKTFPSGDREEYLCKTPDKLPSKQDDDVVTTWEERWNAFLDGEYFDSRPLYKKWLKGIGGIIVKSFISDLLKETKQSQVQLIREELIKIRDVELSDTPMEKSRAAFNLNVLIHELLED